MISWYMSVFCLCALTALCWGHLCLLSPTQRGSMKGINKAGAEDCILLKSPCGGRPKQVPEISIKGGHNFTVVMQKNLDHYYATMPGNFTISLGDEQSESFMEVYRELDTNAPSLSLIYKTIALPQKTGKMTIQVTYQTGNPKAPPVFYQCADIMLV